VDRWVIRGMTAEPGGLDELRREPLDPPVDGHVIDSDAALSQQFFHIAVGQSVPLVQPDGDRDHLPRKPEASED
jgi:hypothetical protein